MIRATGAKLRMLASDIAEGDDDDDNDDRLPCCLDDVDLECPSDDMVLKWRTGCLEKRAKWTRDGASQGIGEMRCRSWLEEERGDDE